MSTTDFNLQLKHHNFQEIMQVKLIATGTH